MIQSLFPMQEEEQEMPDPQTLRFFIPGEARPAGSKRAFAVRRRDGSIMTRPNGSPIITVTDDVDTKGKGKHWRGTCATAAAAAMSGKPIIGRPISLELRFVVMRPRGHYGSGRNAEQLKPSSPRFPTTKPDVTKLIRAVEDALTGIVWRDDCLIVSQWGQKRYGPKPGVWVEVRELEDES